MSVYSIPGGRRGRLWRLGDFARERLRSIPPQCCLPTLVGIVLALDEPPVGIIFNLLKMGYQRLRCHLIHPSNRLVSTSF